MMRKIVRLCVIILPIFVSSFSIQAFGQLSSTFYSSSCPNVSSIVKGVVQKAVNAEARMAASLVRLFFHDCFVQGCDGSVLLDDTATFTGEKTAFPNNNSLRGFDVIDMIKTAVENSCRGKVSCADIVAFAALHSVVLSGGPSWTLLLGRRDSTTASLSLANSNLPSPSSDVSTLVSKFSNQGLSTQDMVALSGAHTIGQARCTVFRSRLYNFNNTGQPDPDINSAYLTSLKAKCPSSSGDNNLSPLDVTSPTTFDNAYYTNLENKKGLLQSDQVLFSTPGSTNTLVTKYQSDSKTFFNDFQNSMINMGNINPLTGSSGQIRKNCRVVN